MKLIEALKLIRRRQTQIEAKAKAVGLDVTCQIYLSGDVVMVE
jgi:hypothetical protein